MEDTGLFKWLQVAFLGGFLPVTAMSFLFLRRTRKEVEFTRVVNILGIAADDAEFARNRVAEQYSSNDFWIPVLFAWLVSMLGFIGLLFGADLVDNNVGKINFLLTGVTMVDDPEQMQALRVRNMVVMTLAFLGAFVWSAQNILHRLCAGDLAPSVYFSAGIRMILAPILALMLSHLILSTAALSAMREGLPAIAFLVGWFPNHALIFLKERFHLIFRQERVANRLPLNMIEGIKTYDRARLLELGIDDAQNLASANFIELMLRTSYNPAQIIDWIGQAKLYVYFKDDVTLLRKHQVRTVSDMLLAWRDSQLLEDVASATGLGGVGLRLFCRRMAEDPEVEQLLGFQKRLAANSKTAQHAKGIKKKQSAAEPQGQKAQAERHRNV